MNLLLKPLKKFLDFIVYSNFFIAVCIALFTLQTAIVFPHQSDQILLFIPLNFIATFTLYNLQRLYFSAQLKNDSKYTWYTKNRRLIFTLIILTISCSFNFLVTFFLQNVTSLIVYGCLGVLSIFYFLPPLQLRKYGLLKPFIITFVIICTSVILPLATTFNKVTLIYAVNQFFFIAALCICFDIRDVEIDALGNQKTIPIKFGITNTKYLVVALLLFYLATGFFVPNTYFPTTAIFVTVLSILLTIFAKPKRHYYFYLLLVDGAIIVQCLLLLFLNKV